jgi:hypothetical protein
LHEWLKRQEKVNLGVLPLDPIVWDQENIDSLKELDNECTQVIHFWFSRVKEGKIVEFNIEYIESFSEAERKF